MFSTDIKVLVALATTPIFLLYFHIMPQAENVRILSQTDTKLIYFKLY